MIHLKIDKSDLISPDLKRVLKNAYRQQVKLHHPDTGGDAATFRKIHQAYEELAHWAENPIFTRLRGFPDKWFYDASTNRWTQPITIRR